MYTVSNMIRCMVTLTSLYLKLLGILVTVAIITLRYCGKPKICQLNSEAVHVESPSVSDTFIVY